MPRQSHGHDLGKGLVPRLPAALWYHLLPLFFFFTPAVETSCAPCVWSKQQTHVMCFRFLCFLASMARAGDAQQHLGTFRLIQTEWLGSPAEMATTHCLHGHPKTFGAISGGVPPLFTETSFWVQFGQRGTGRFVARCPWACQGRGSGAGVTASPVCRTSLVQQRRERHPELWPERGAGVRAGPREGAALAGSEPVRAALAPRPLAWERRGRALPQSLAVPSALTGSAEIAAGPVLPPPWPRSLRTEVARAATAAAAAASGAAFSP